MVLTTDHSLAYRYAFSNSRSSMAANGNKFVLLNLFQLPTTHQRTSSASLGYQVSDADRRSRDGPGNPILPIPYSAEQYYAMIATSSPSTISATCEYTFACISTSHPLTHMAYSGPRSSIRASSVFLEGRIQHPVLGASAQSGYAEPADPCL
jgi:hypothetical protein